MAKKGAHDAQLVRSITQTDIHTLTTANCGRVMLTVTPNMVPPRYISQLRNAGILVSLGHSNASFAETQAGLNAGASAFTHLFNAMSQITGREPGMVGAAFADMESHISFIADVFHVHDTIMKLALAATNSGRFMLITDAMSSAAGGPQQFEVQGRKVKVIDDKLQLDDGTLAGSNLTMDEAVRNAINRLGVDIANALRMASLNPARFLKLDHELGRIAPGYRACLVHLDQKLNVLEIWVDGT